MSTFLLNMRSNQILKWLVSNFEHNFVKAWIIVKSIVKLINNS